MDEIDQWLDAPAGTPLPDLKNQDEVDRWLDEPAATPAVAPPVMSPSPIDDPDGFLDSPPRPDDTGAFMRGFKGALQQQLPEDVASAIEGVSVLTGLGAKLDESGKPIPGTHETQIPEYLRELAQSGVQYERQVPSFSDIKNLGDVGTYIAESAGSGVGSTVPSMITGGAGGYLGSRVSKSKYGALGGTIAGAAIPSAAQNFGSLYGALVQEGVPKEKAAEYAAAATAPIVALDVAAPTSWLARLTGDAKREAMRSLAKRIAQEAAKGVGTEAATEAAQTGIEKGTIAAATDRPVFTPENARDIADAFIQGGLGGGVMGGVTGVVPDKPIAAPPPTAPAAAPAAPAPRPAAPPIDIPVGATVGIATLGGPTRVRVEAVQDGNVFYRDAEGSVFGMPAEDFSSSIVAVPEPADAIRGDATTVPEPPQRTPEYTDYGDINDFDPNAERERPAPAPPAPQQKLGLPETQAITRAAAAAREFRKAAVEATDRERAAYLNQQADALDEEAMTLRRQLAARSDQGGVGVPAQDVRARATLGPLGEAAPAVSEAQTGPQPVQVRPAQTPLERNAPAVSEAQTGPQPVQVRPSQTPLERGAPRDVVVDDDILQSAVQDSASAGMWRHDIETDAQGVIPGKLRSLDKRINSGEYAIEDVAADWAKTRDTIRSKYGDEVVLYRADAPEGEKNARAKTLYFGDKKMATRFEADDRAALPQRVRVDDIVAVYATPSGYYEFIVKNLPTTQTVRPVDTRTALERNAPTVSEAVTGPVPQAVRPVDTRTELERAAPAQNEAVTPTPPLPPKPKPTVEQLVRNRTAKLNDPESIARQTGLTPEAVRAELNRIAGRPNGPIRQVRGKVTVDPKTGQPVQSARAGLLTYAPQRTTPMSILEALSAAGGVQDRGGDLASMGADTWHRGKPGKRPLINEKGIAFDELGDWAEREGYLSPRAVDATTGENYHRDPAEVMAMIDRELRGQKQLPLGEIEDQAVQNEPTPLERKEHRLRTDLARLQESPAPDATLDEMEAQIEERLAMMNAATVDDAVDMINEDLDALDRVMEEYYGDTWQPDADEAAAAQEGIPESAGRPAAVERGEGTGAAGDVDRGAAGRGDAAEVDTGSLGSESARGSPGAYDDYAAEFDAYLGARADKKQAAAEWVFGKGRETGHEYVVAIDGDGNVIGAGTSNQKNSVGFSDAVYDMMNAPGAKLDLIHNHPSNSTVSQTDLSVLGRQGVRVIYAFGKNGLTSVAGLKTPIQIDTSRITVPQFSEIIKQIANAAHDGAVQTINAERASLHLDIDTEVELIGIAMNQGLADAGLTVFSYRYQINPMLIGVLQRATAAAKRNADEAIAGAKDQVRRPAGLEEIPGGGPTVLDGKRSDGADRSANREEAEAAGDQAGQADSAERSSRASRRPLLGAQEDRVNDVRQILQGARPPAAGIGDVDRGPSSGQRAGSGTQGVLDEGGPDRQDVGVSDSTERAGRRGEYLSSVQSAQSENRLTVASILSRFRRRPGAARDAARQNQKLSALKGPPELRKLSKLSSLISFAATIASKDTMSARYYTAEKAMARYSEALVRDGARRTAQYYSDQIGPEGRAKINKILEHDRLVGLNRKNTGKRIAVRMPENYTGQLAKPGDVVTLTKPESEALMQLREFFDDRWDKFGEAMAHQFGWDGPFTEDAINAAIKSADSVRSRNQATRALEIYRMVADMKRVGYVPFARYGDTKISIRPKPKAEPGKDGMQFGKPVHVELVPTDTPLDLILDRRGEPLGVDNRRKELEKQYPRSDYDYEVTPLNTLADARKVDLPAVEKMFMVMNAKSPDLGPKFFEEIVQEIFDQRKAGFRKQSHNVPGYSVDFERAIADYIHQTSSVVARMELGKDVNRAYEGTQSHPDKAIADFWKEYREYIEKPGDDFSGLRKIAFWSFIWGSPASAIVNITQTPLVTLPQTASWAGPKALPTLAGAIGETLSATKIGKDGLTLDWSRLGRTPAEKRMIAQLRDEGVLDPVIARDLQGYDRGTTPTNRKWNRRLDRAYEIGASAFNLMEMANRVGAALGAFRLAQDPATMARAQKVYAQDGEFRQMVGRNGTPLDIARFMVDETQFMGGKRGRPTVMRGAGSLLLQWKQYQANWLRLLYKNMSRMGPEGKLAGTTMLLALVGAAGLLGIPFAEDALDAATWGIKTATGIDPLIERRMARWLRDAGMGEIGAEIAMHGPSREYLGIDLGSRIGMGEMVPESDIGNAFPLLGATVGKLGEVWDRATSGQPLGAAAALMPKGVADITKALAVLPEEGYRTKKGDIGLFPDEIRAGDQLARFFGFQPARFSRKSEYKYAQRQLAAATQEASTKLLTNVAAELALATQAAKAGDQKASQRHMRRYTSLLRENAQQLQDKDLPGWMKIPQPAARAIKARLQQIMDFDKATLKRSGKMKRPELLDYPLPIE